MRAGPARAASAPGSRVVSPEHEAAFISIIQFIAAKKLCHHADRRDSIKVLHMHRQYDAARLLESVDDDAYGAIVARLMGPATGPKTPKGTLIDLDADPDKRQS